MHRDVLLFDARQAAQSRSLALNRKRRAKRAGKVTNCAAALIDAPQPWAEAPSLGSLAVKIDKCPIIRQIGLAWKAHPTAERPASKALK
jgi:hypothetical protein